MLSLLGNLTYGGGVNTKNSLPLSARYIADGLQILFHSISGPYLITNLPWLIGSLGKSESFSKLGCSLTKSRHYGRRCTNICTILCIWAK